MICFVFCSYCIWGKNIIWKLYKEVYFKSECFSKDYKKEKDYRKEKYLVRFEYFFSIYEVFIYVYVKLWRFII